jgi:hypothetical protein
MEGNGQLHSPAALTPGEGASGIHSIGGWVGPRTGLDAVEYRKSLVPAGNGTPAIQPVAIPTKLSLHVLPNAYPLLLTRGKETET